MKTLTTAKGDLLRSRNLQTGINMVDLMMWLVIAAILLAASIQGVGYYREAVILYYLKNDAIGAAANVKSSAAQNQGNIDQTIVDAGIDTTKWSEGTISVGKSHTRSVYSITAGNPEITRSVVYCSNDGITVLQNTDLPSFVCGGTVVAGPPDTGGGGGDTGDGDDGSGGTGGGGDTGTGGTGAPLTGTTVLAGWGNDASHRMGAGPFTQTTNYGILEGKTVTNLTYSSNSRACVLGDSILYCFYVNGTSSQMQPVNMQSIGVLAGKTVTALSGSNNTMCVIADAKAYCWGTNTNGKVGNGGTATVANPVAVVDTGVLAGKSLVDIEVGYAHTCAVDTEGKAYCWGLNTAGQLGRGNITSSTTPVAVTSTGALAGKTIKDISITDGLAGGTCVIASDDYLYCWGSASITGTWGTGTNSPGASANYEWVPVRTANTGVTAGKTFSKVGGFGTAMCAVSDGTQYCWGTTDNGTPASTKNAPVAITAGLPAGQTVIQTDSRCVIMSGGAAYCLPNTTGSAVAFSRMAHTDVDPLNTRPVTEIGGEVCIMSGGQPWCVYAYSGAIPSMIRIPHPVVSDLTKYSSPINLSTGSLMEGKTITSATSSYAHGCAVADNEVYCWGYNDYGKVGDPALAPGEIVTRPVKVVGLPAGEVTAVATSERTNCALISGAVYCWGGGVEGGLGNGAFTDSGTPVRVSGLDDKTLTSLVAGYRFLCAADSDEMYCWGRNNQGMIGNGTTTNAGVPTLVAEIAGKNITSIDAQSYGVCAVADGTPWCWGDNSSWAQIDNTWANVLSPRALNMTSMGGKTAKAVSVGENGFCMIASDDNVYCWGSPVYGLFANGDGNTDTPVYTPQLITLPSPVTSLGNGDYHTCALAGGTVYCWGASYYGQLGHGVLDDESYVVKTVDTSGVLAGKTVKRLFVGQDSNFVILQ